MCDSRDSCVVVKRHKAQGSCAWSCARCTAAWEQEHAHSHYPHCRRVEGDPCAGRTDVPRVEPVAHRIMAQQIRSQAYYRIVHDCICEAKKAPPYRRGCGDLDPCGDLDDDLADGEPAFAIPLPRLSSERVLPPRSPCCSTEMNERQAGQRFRRKCLHVTLATNIVRQAKAAPTQRDMSAVQLISPLSDRLRQNDAHISPSQSSMAAALLRGKERVPKEQTTRTTGYLCEEDSQICV